MRGQQRTLSNWNNVKTGEFGKCQGSGSSVVDTSAVEGWTGTAGQHIQQAALREGNTVQGRKGEGGQKNHKGKQISGPVGGLVA